MKWNLNLVTSYDIGERNLFQLRSEAGAYKVAIRNDFYDIPKNERKFPICNESAWGDRPQHIEIQYRCRSTDAINFYVFFAKCFAAVYSRRRETKSSWLGGIFSEYICMKFAFGFWSIESADKLPGTVTQVSSSANLAFYGTNPSSVEQLISMDADKQFSR